MSSFLRRPRIISPRRAVPEPPRERVEAAYTQQDRLPDGHVVYNNRPEPETMRLRMSRDDVDRVRPIIVTHTGKSERTREYGFFDEERGVWVAYRMNRQGGVVRYDIADLNTVEIEKGKDIRI